MPPTTLTGRLFQIRPMGKRLAFAVLRCLDQEYLCVFPGRPDIAEESIVRITGMLRPAEKSRKFAEEIHVDDVQVLAENTSTTTMARLRQLPYSRDILSDQHVYMRLPEVRERLLKKWTAIKAVRDLMEDERYVEVQSPRIVGSMADGPTMKFKVDFFGREAYLSLSNLLFHTAFVAGDFSSVFEISPLFRADINHSSQHLSEFLILEVTAAHRGRDDMIALSDRIVRRVCAHTDAPLPDEHLADIPVVTYEDVVAITTKSEDHAPLQRGDRIKPYHARTVARHLNRPLFWVVDMPAHHKAFFSSTRYDPLVGTEVANDFRLYWDEVGIIDGGERVTSPQRLLERMAEQRLDPVRFDYYVKVVKSGLPPFTGLGLGIDRLMAKCMSLANIRQVVPFPRFIDHLEP
ncbi:amino acid--tRNA ligase-related protein [Streptomyces sp. NPDC001351]|uniref:amino acid--tRNA ligase-related protein n=1 Tax=Streptomyces sp. NPDC001351 TaxID=3364564 RepID=UPI0036A6C9F7